MKSITFYSYKGGGGRTLAAINFAVYLARLGLRTIILDMDLEAPGVDSKFPGFTLPGNQRGVLDYILEFQQTNADPGSVRNIYLDVPVTTPRGDFSLGLIPAGAYLSADYSKKLNELDWSRIFSPERDGVAFFKQLLARISGELKPDFLIIDSRTGIGEIGGVCTQQLADEVVLISSLAGESVKMTRHLVDAITASAIAKRLGKKIEVKVVLARIPKLNDPTVQKAAYSAQFGVPENQMFFLFSSAALERGEFIALLGTHKDEELVSNYINLFHGLDIGLADKNIRDQISKTEASILSVSPEESEARVLELVALYPHPEVYRTAMRYYRLSRKSEGVFMQACRLLEVKPDDKEAQNQAIESFLSERPPIGPYGFGRRHGKFDEKTLSRVAEIGWAVFNRNGLSPVQLLSFAGLLEDAGDNKKAHTVAMAAIDSKIAPDWRLHAYAVAARTAFKSGQSDVGRELLANIPPEQLRGPLAEFAIKAACQTEDLVAAFELALTVIQQDITIAVVTLAADLAAKLGRKAELIHAILASNNLDYVIGNPDIHERLAKIGLEEVIRSLPESRRRRIR